MRLRHPELDFWINVFLSEHEGRWLATAILADEADIGSGRTRVLGPAELRRVQPPATGHPFEGPGPGSPKLTPEPTTRLANVAADEDLVSACEGRHPCGHVDSKPDHVRARGLDLAGMKPGAHVQAQARRLGQDVPGRVEGATGALRMSPRRRHRSS